MRTPGANTGNLAVIPPKDVELSDCLAETFFSPDTDTTVGDLGFGGPATGANHDAQVFGEKSVENKPHNAIHVDIGREWTQGGKQLEGWMINPDTAALDPIFWLHHANIDRVWSVWNRTSPSNTDPAAPVNVGGRKITWASSVKFSFYDASGKSVTMTPSQVIDTRTAPFAYDYEDTGKLAKAAVAAGEEGIMARQPRSEMVGANSKKVTLTGSAQTTMIATQEPAGPAKAKARAARAPVQGKTFLYIEHVISKQSHATYEVYVNLPENADAAANQEHYAGAMHLFGVRHASTRSEQHAGSGLNFSFDITKLVDALRAKNEWDDKNVRVTFEPRGQVGETSQAIPEHDPIKIGRVSLYRT
jgi:tyrosinase